MPYRIITIPFEPDKGCFIEDDINSFTINKRIRNTNIQFFTSKEKAYWTIFIEYEDLIEKERGLIELTEQQNLLYQRLKEWRKRKAEEAGVPVYIIATNGEINELIKRMPQTIESLKGIRGFGRKKIERYGREIVDLICAFIKNG